MKHKKDNNLVVQYFTGTGSEMLLMKFQAMKIHLWLYYFKLLSRLTGSLNEKDKSYSTGIGLS
jgi:hypothetical protein